MTTPAPKPAGPYDEAIAALGVQINALNQELKALRDGHAPKADLDALRAELAEANKELKALKDKNAPEPKSKAGAKPKPEDEEPAPEESCLGGYWG